MRFFGLWQLAAFGRLLKFMFWAAVVVILAYCFLPASWTPYVLAAAWGFVVAVVLVLRAFMKSHADRGERR